MSTYPRKFTYNKPEGFADSTKYILLYHDGSSARETKDGHIVEPGFNWPKGDIERFVKEGTWKEVDEQTAKAALKPAPKARRFQLKNGPFGPRENPYHFESDENGKGWWVYASGYRSPADAYRTLEKALKCVADGDWVEIGTNVPPVEAKASPVVPKCSDFYVVGRKFGPYSTIAGLSSAEAFAKSLAEAFAKSLAEQSSSPVYLFKPVKSFTLVQTAPTVEEKTL